MSQQFSFPVLADHDLLPCLKEMEIPLSAATLAKPTPELVRPVYETAITTLMGITRCPFSLRIFAHLSFVSRGSLPCALPLSFYSWLTTSSLISMNVYEWRVVQRLQTPPLSLAILLYTS